MSELEHIKFSKILAYQSAPSMLGIKPANLFTVDKHKFSIDENINMFNYKAASKGLKIKVLNETVNRKLLIIYNERLLQKQLSDSSVKKCFKKFGYTSDMNVDESLERLSSRIKSDGSFPHEIGLFLGYPVADVEGFIKNKGENYLICGCWKVYSNEKKAKRIFDNYDKCREYLCNKLDQGIDIYKALKIM